MSHGNPDPSTPGKESMKLWRVGQTTIKEVECNGFLWPDAEGERVYHHTHFHTAEEAWQKVVAMNKGAVESTLGEIKILEEKLQKARVQIVDRCRNWMEAENNFRKWKEVRSGGSIA